MIITQILSTCCVVLPETFPIELTGGWMVKWLTFGNLFYQFIDLKKGIGEE